MVLKFPIFFLREALKRSEHKHLLEYVSACAHVCIFVQCVHNVWVCVCAMYEHVWLHLYIYHINKWQIFMFTEIIGKLSKYIYIFSQNFILSWNLHKCICSNMWFQILTHFYNGTVQLQLQMSVPKIWRNITACCILWRESN